MIKPIVTEKATATSEKLNRYTFRDTRLLVYSMKSLHVHQRNLLQSEKDAQADATPKVTARHAMSAAATSVNSVLSTSREQKTVCQRP